MAAGSSQNIIWDAGGIANVRIEYTINNGISWNTIVAAQKAMVFTLGIKFQILQLLIVRLE